jgi:hypothetical protein
VGPRGPRCGDPSSAGSGSPTGRWASAGPKGWGIPAECGSSCPTWSWGLAGPERQGTQGQGSCQGGDLTVQCGADPQQVLRVREPGGAEQWLHRSMGQGHGGLAALFVDHGMEKSSTIKGFKVLNFRLSLVLYPSQVYLQSLSKVPNSQSSQSLWLFPGSHLFFVCLFVWHS